MEDNRNSFASVIGLATVVLLIPQLIFTAIPNMFFGFEHSETDEIIHVTEQAKIIGSVYMSLENVEKSQIDSLVTGIAAEYEAGGNAIERIEVKSDFEEDDLLWLIAINSVLHQQDLDSMSAADIRRFCTSRLSSTSKILGGSTKTLEVEVKKIDPEALMDQLGFDNEAKVWAGALYEAISESDALEKYKDHFDVPPPSCEGDTSGGGSITPGGSGGSVERAAACLREAGAAPSRFWAYVLVRNVDTADYVERMKKCAETETNESCREMIKDNIKEIGQGVASDAIRHRFFLVFQYEARMKSKGNSVAAIVQRLNEEADTARRYLDVCELAVLEPRYADDFILKLLYEIINKRTSLSGSSCRRACLI